jgi:undecaprenyl diphosphate synthase
MHASSIDLATSPTPTRIPVHTAFIMDGNGRWATQRGFPRLAGHRAGVENIRPILRECGQLGIEYVTMYAFSTENWTRPRSEIDGLMQLMGEFIDREGMALHEEGVRVRHLGSLEGIPLRLQRRIEWLIDLTQHNTRLTAAVALNYGGRSDVVGAVRSMVVEGLRIEEINERALASRLSTHGMPDPDLIIRTGGEWRLSNFLVWQAAYSEYWSTQVLWPDFSPECLRAAIRDYSHRERRFGGLGPVQVAPAVQAPASIALVPSSVAPAEATEQATAAPTTEEPTSSAAEIAPGFSSVAEGIAAFAAGAFVLLVDDEERENEGDLAIAAEYVTPEAINFMATHCRGLICMPMQGGRLDELEIPYMVPREAGDMNVGFTVSVDARACSTGISASDRALTIRTLLDPAAKPSDLVKPGHLFPLRYTEGGVLRRPGHTEASVDLAMLAGCYPAAVICEVMSADGTMARRAELLAFAARHGIAAVTVSALLEYRSAQEQAAARGPSTPAHAS